MILCQHFEQLEDYHGGEEGDHKPENSKVLTNLKNQIVKTGKCSMCKEKTSLVICLNPACFHVGCGRAAGGHAIDHFKKLHSSDQTHCISFDPRTNQCWCYACDDWASTPESILALFEQSTSNSRSIGSSMRSSTSSTFSTKSTINTCSGLYNMGNSCYMSAALQAIMNCPSIFSFFSECSSYLCYQPCDGNPPKSKRVSESFLELVNAVIEANGSALNPNRLVREIKMINPMFHGYTQQDTMDFLRCILQKLHEELFMRIPSTKVSPIRRSSRLAKSQGEECEDDDTDDNAKTIESSVISNTFSGTLNSEIICSRCKTVSVKKDPFFDVCVQITAHSDAKTPNSGKHKPSGGYLGSLFTSFTESIGIQGKSVRLEACLAAFCAPETLSGSEKYRCETCKDLVVSEKRLSFHQLPPVLCIQLKRFKHDSYFSSKINTHISFPLDSLDMRPFLHANSCAGESRYYLSSIISHRGSFGGGHYVAYCRNWKSGQWLEFDDSTVKVVDEEFVGKVQAYVLFYSLVDWNQRIERKKYLEPIQNAIAQRDHKRDPIQEEAEGQFVLMSKLWFNNWLFTADPGPVRNPEFVCPHGLLLPCTKGITDPERDLFIPVPRPIFDHFAATHNTLSPNQTLMDSKSMVPCKQCQLDQDAIERRREQESRDISEIDSTSIASGQCWYLINTEWIQKWGRFKDGKAPPPPQINNEILLDSQGNPKKDLIRGKHYRGLNEQVWNYFIAAYKGGPVIARKHINIYSPPAAVPKIGIALRSSQKADSTAALSSSSSSHSLPSINISPQYDDDFVDVVGQ